MSHGVQINRLPYYDETQVFIYERFPDGEVATYETVIKHLKGNEIFEPLTPTLKLRNGGDDFFQAFMDEMWRLGIRPSRKFNADTQAQSEHLADMRRIVAKQLGVKLP